MKNVIWAPLIMICLSLIGCSVGPSAEAPTPTAYPTYTPLPTYTIYPTYTLPPLATMVPTETPAPTTQPTETPVVLSGPSLTDILAAFRAAGLEAENPRPMTVQDYGTAPMVAAEGYRFLIPSLCEDCGGRLFRFDNLDSRDRMKAYYDELGKASAWFFSWAFSEGYYLLQLNGELTEESAQKYEAVLEGEVRGESDRVSVPLTPSATPLAPTAHPVVPQDARPSAYICGNASPEWPGGEVGRISVIASRTRVNPTWGSTVIELALRNNTAQPVGPISLSAIAYSAGGELFAIGGDQGFNPRYYVAPGEIAMGYVYFDAELPDDAIVEYEATAKSPSKVGADLDVAECNLVQNRIVGMLKNNSGGVVSGPIVVNVYCVDDNGSLLNHHSEYTQKDTADPGGSVPFQVNLDEDVCPVFLVAASGYAW